MSSNAIVVAMPKQDTTLILRQSDAILELKRRMKPGVHYGPPYPGSTKETLLKPGAEWLAKRFGLRSHYEELTKRIDFDFDRPERAFILFEYRCLMVDIETDTVVGEAIGSANSREDKYAWRWVSEHDLPPGVDTTYIASKDGTLVEFDFAVRKAETSGKYGKPAEYWQAFHDAIENRTVRMVEKEDSKGVKRSAYEIGGRLYRLPHENPLDLLNTLSKMAQKRSKVSSVMEATGASSYFAPGDEEVSDIYVSEDDAGVVDAELVGDVIDVEPSKSSSEPSAAVRGAGIQPSQPPEPPPVEYEDLPERVRTNPNVYHCNQLIVTQTRTARQFVLRVAQTQTNIPLTDLSVLEGVYVGDVLAVELKARGAPYVLTPTWVVVADRAPDGAWQVLSVATEMPVS